MKRLLLSSALVACLLASGCKKNLQTDDAVRQGVMNYLSQKKGLSVSGMDIKVTQITFRENEADAVVSFAPKGGDPSAGMTIRYTLERKDNAWVVKQRADSGGHGASQMPGAMMPPAEMPQGTMPPGMPPNHPQTAPGGAMPAPKK